MEICEGIKVFFLFLCNYEIWHTINCRVLYFIFYYINLFISYRLFFYFLSFIKYKNSLKFFFLLCVLIQATQKNCTKLTPGNRVDDRYQISITLVSESLEFFFFLSWLKLFFHSLWWIFLGGKRVNNLVNFYKIFLKFFKNYY